MAQQILQVEPETELRFRGPIGEEEVRANLKMTNISDKNVQFKIKTTCPTSYCVKPTMGIIKPKNSANCIVSLQPLYTRKKSHKFMVQFMQTKEDTADDLEIKWDDISPGQIMEVRLKSVFEVAGANTKMKGVSTKAAELNDSSVKRTKNADSAKVAAHKDTSAKKTNKSCPVKADSVNVTALKDSSVKGTNKNCAVKVDGTKVSALKDSSVKKTNKKRSVKAEPTKVSARKQTAIKRTIIDCPDKAGSEKVSAVKDNSVKGDNKDCSDKTNSAKVSALKESSVKITIEDCQDIADSANVSVLKDSLVKRTDKYCLDKCEICLKNGIHEAATRFCETCQSSICDFCNYRHNTVEALRDHQVSDEMRSFEGRFNQAVENRTTESHKLVFKDVACQTDDASCNCCIVC